MFIMVDGIDGSGKSTVVESWKEYLVAQGNAVFDLKKYWKETGASPTLAALRGYDFIISGEPTYVGIGATIRQELIRTGTDYSARSIAEAYALDRLILYRTLLLPLLAEGKCVIQDRGVSTSFAYQSAADPSITAEFLSSLEGNALALQHRPDYLVLVKATPAVAMERLAKRSDKQDNVIFEHLAFEERLAQRFVDPAYRGLFINQGSQIRELSGDAGIDILREEALNLLKTLHTSVIPAQAGIQQR